MTHPRRAAGMTISTCRIIVLVLCVLAMTHVLHGASSARPLVAASSNDHLWFVSDAFRLNESPLLCHHALDMPGPYVSRTVTLSRRPALMAAAEREVWLVFPERVIGDAVRREVFTLRIEYDEALQMYRPSPRDRLRVVDTLPGSGSLAGLVGTRNGPVALIVPSRPADLPRRPGSPAIDEPPPENVPGVENESTRIDDDALPRLLMLSTERWTDLDLPENFVPSRGAMLGVDGVDRDRLHLLSPDPADRSRTRHHVRQHDGSWTQHELALDLTNIETLENVAGRLVVVIAESADHGGEPAMRLTYLRSGRLLHFGRFDPPSGHWAVLGMGDGLRLLDASTRGEVALLPIQPVTGALGERELMRDHPLPAGRLWHMMVMLTLTVFAVLLVLIMRPSAQEPVQLPDALTPAPLGSRAFALLIDLIPGAIIAVLLLRAPPSQLLHLPILATTPGDALPHLVMVAITLAHGTATELIAATTLGKSLLGLRVTNGEGRQPGVGQILLRNALKALVFLVPPLAIFTALNAYMQGVNDLVARTFILHPKPPDAAESSEQDGRG